MAAIRWIIGLFRAIPLFVQYIVLPLGLFAFVFFYPFKSKLAWLLAVLPSGLYLSVIFLSGVWEMSGGYYTRYVLVGIYLAVAVFSFWRARKAPFFLKPNGGVGVIWAFCLLACIVLGTLSVNIVRASGFDEEPIRLQFPFRDGTYLINDGGDGSISNLANYHFSDEGNIRRRYNTAERYANDIVIIDSLGFEGEHFGNEKSLDDYYIFDANVYSPCDGIVFDVQDGYDDIPMNGNVTDTGNGVAILVDDVYVVLWHLEKGTIAVKEGDFIRAGDFIGKIGNSGITATPHLHIHATRSGINYMSGEGVPVLYDGRNPTKNSLFIME